MARLLYKLLVLTLHLMTSNAMMMRNDALISKMVSNFQKDNSITGEQPRSDQYQQPHSDQYQQPHSDQYQQPHSDQYQQQQQQQQQQQIQQQQQQIQQQQQQLQQPKNVIVMMQNVLCRNFPSIPCDLIMEDDTLRKLIERSIQQLKYKKLTIEKTTPMPGYHLTLFPSINSEDLSNFLQVSDTGYFSKGKPEKSRLRKHKKALSKSNVEQLTGERDPKKKQSKKDNLRTTLYNGRKKIRKFYPHKIKYKDKLKGRKDFGDYSEEKLSMSVEVPDITMGGRKRMNYKMEPAEPPMWRIDYMKHGEPSLNMFGYEPDRLKEKLVKTGPNVIVSDNMIEQVSRKDVLHPDVYIKKNYIRKNGLDMNSGAID